MMDALGHWGTTNLPGVLKTWHKRLELVWEDFPLHPTVMAHDTTQHQRIRALGVTDEALIIGYGDWDNNLGPVDVIGYDLSTKDPLTLFGPCPNEAWDRIRIIDGHVYLPWTDPTVGNQGGFTTNRAGVWSNVNIGPSDSMVHTFDIAKIDGKIHACGSRTATVPGQGGVGVVWREESPGVWVESFRGSLVDPLARFYRFNHQPDGSVRVQNSRGGLETFSTTDGETWTALPDEPQWALLDNTSYDSPGPLPSGWPDPLGTRTASITHEGWVYVAGTGGRVKRARLPGPVSVFAATFTETF